MTHYCDGCQTPSARAGYCARCRPALTCPGLARLFIGAFMFMGASGGLDQTPLADAQASVNLLALGALLAGWGTHRMQRGSTLGTLRGYRNRLLARRYLRRVVVHQRRLGVRL